MFRQLGNVILRSTNNNSRSFHPNGTRAFANTAEVRDEAFYEMWAKKRVFFYQIDLRGRLFLDIPSLRRRNDATCLKAKDFLDFFFSHIQPCPKTFVPKARVHQVWAEALGKYSHEYPFMSPCGKELNLIKADDTPIVFRDIVPSEENPSRDELLYAGNLREPFDPSKIFVKMETERVYYSRPLPNGEKDTCLIHADLAQRLSKTFSLSESPYWIWHSVRYPLEFK